jgi:hypothetical protein
MMIKSSFPGAWVNPDRSVDFEIRHLNHVFFSDSILFYSKDDSSESFNAFVRTCTEFMNVMVTGVSLMIRGGISYGEFYVDTKTNAYIGQALLDAYELEERIDWMGLCIDDSAASTENFKLCKNKFPMLIHRSITPLKGATAVYPFAVNYADEDYLGFTEFSIKRGLRDCLNRKTAELAGQASELAKAVRRIENTQAFFNHIKQD